MYQVHSFLIRRTELRVFSAYILRMYITYATRKQTNRTEKENIRGKHEYFPYACAACPSTQIRRGIPSRVESPL
ncbi:hypothetical protein ANTQUA_LOCUS7569 [Anthophora quadrimaculata]